MSDFLKNNILMIGAVFLILIGVLIPQPLIGLAVSLALAVISFFYPKIGIYSLLVYFPLRSFL
ncbi:hypothetical protein ABTK66_18510, partial [Acinetobacter baumannii]